MPRNILSILLLFIAALAAAQCPGPSQRTALLNLQRALEVEGTRAGQIPLSDTCGNQRYAQYVEVNLDTIAYTPTPTGNTDNLSEFVIDPTGAIFYIDWQGNSIEFAGGSGSCDVDWLQISDNSCPDNINDSIYHKKYASVGAQYVWPGAEFLVNDSTASGIAVIQGSRNARLALYDGQAPGTFLMIDHGGTTPVVYMPVAANLIFKTTAGTPQTPVGSQVNHFGINTQDSTIQMFRYPNTRVDTQAVENLLYTDPVGKVRSRDIAYFIDTLGFGQNIYNSNGFFPPNKERAARLDSFSQVSFFAPNDTRLLNLYGGSDSAGTGAYAFLMTDNEDAFIGVQHDGSEGIIRGQWPHGGRFNVESFGQLSYTSQGDAETIIHNENTAGDFVDIRMDTTGQVVEFSASNEDLGLQSSFGFDFSSAYQYNTGLRIRLADQFADARQILVADDLGFFHYADADTASVNIYNTSGSIPADTNRIISLNEESLLTVLYPGAINAMEIYGGTDAGGTDATLAVYSPATTGVQMTLSLQDNLLQMGDISGGGSGFGVLIDNTDAMYTGQVLPSPGAGQWTKYDDGNNTTTWYNSDYGISVGSESYWNGAQEMELKWPSAFNVHSNDNHAYIYQTDDELEVLAYDDQGSYMTYTISADTTGNMDFRTTRSFGGLDQNSFLSLRNEPDGVVSAALSAYNGNAPRTLNSVVVDTSGVGINTQGGVGNEFQVLQSDGEKSYWGVTVEDNVAAGVLNADQLSFDADGWTAVNANRCLAVFGSGTINPSIAITEILITDTATTSTVNLNYVPGELDGASYNTNGFSTVRYIYNWGSGDCTVDTNQDWTFRTMGGTPGGDATLTIPTGQAYKLIWRGGTTEANSRFYCIRIQ